MDWTETLNSALNYLEDNILRDVGYVEAAGAVGFSPFHFQRAFSLMTGMTVGEYLRNRRLSLAGEALSRQDTKVIDAALQYGYETPESFSKAFRRFHGVTPQQAKHPGVQLKNFPRLTVKIILEGGSIMDYRIEEKPAFDVVLKVRTFTDETCTKGIPAFWDEYSKAGLFSKVCGEFGVCLEKAATGANEFRYGIGAEARLTDGVPEGFELIEVPASTWVIFPCKGAMPDSIQTLWPRVYSEWLPSSGYEFLSCYDIEYYTAGDTSSPDYYTELWLPVRKKEA